MRSLGNTSIVSKSLGVVQIWVLNLILTKSIFSNILLALGVLLGKCLVCLRLLTHR